MLKQLGIAAACGIALYGIARYINNNFVLVIDTSGNFPDLLATSIESTDALETRQEATDHDAQGGVRAEDTPLAEVTCGDSGQSPPIGAVTQVAPCP